MIRSSRSGFSLAELMVALVLGAIVSGAILATLASTTRLARWHLERVAWNEARRIVTAVLDDEVRYLEPGHDLALASDTLGLRAFRGIGIACGPRPDGAVVRYRGQRLPEPAKDSIIVLDSDDGAGRASVLVGVRVLGEFDQACTPAPGEAVHRWTTGESLAQGALLLVFESGSYHLSDRAFRYRRGDSGRQPLTAEVFAVKPGEFGGLPRGGEEGRGDGIGGEVFDGWPALEIVLIRHDPGTREGALVDTSSSGHARHRVGLLNLEAER